MTLTIATVFSPLIASIRLDILIWIVGIPMLLTALVLLWVQYRHSRTLKGNVTRLAKLKNHSVEYDFILKAMKLAVWRLDVPTHAVTMGMGNIMRAKRLLMIINGNKQEAATKLLMEDRIDPKCPCTFMRLHRDATVVIEKKLADEIGYKG